MAEVRSADEEHATTASSRVVARVLVVAMLAVLLVPAGQVEVWATPVTLSETIDGVAVDPDFDPGDLPSAVLLDAQAEADPGPGAPAVTAPDDTPAPDDAPDTAGTPDADEGPVWLRSEIHEAPLAFNTVGISAPLEVTAVAIRTSMDGEAWSAWEPLAFLDIYDGPDPGEREVTADQGVRNHTEPLWVEEARYLQLEVVGGDPEALELTLIDSMHLNNGPVERHVSTGDAADATGLDIVSRARWGADETITRTSRTVSQVHMGIVHHTAHTTSSAANTYSRDQAPGLMRAMHRYHTVTLGWADLGYSVVVDRFGTIYEGRRGGFTNGVVGAHAAGYNVGTFGVSVIGNFVNAEPSAAAIQSLTDVIAVKSAIHGIDPTGTTNQVGDGRTRPTIIGHRDVGQTACPGRIQDRLPAIRLEARSTAVRFPDVAYSSPHRTAIIELADAGVTNGCTANQFCPRDSLTRAQASSFVLQALELDPIAGSQFPDVPVGAVHAGAINALVQRGWLIGYPDGTFKPWEELTRGQLATLLARALEQPLTAPWTDPYPDVSRFATHAPGIAALKELGIRGDCGSGRFCADDTALRDSTASFVNMARKVIGEVRAGVVVAARVELDGEELLSPLAIQPRFQVDVTDPSGTVIATRYGLTPGQELTLTNEDGLTHGIRYNVQVAVQPGTVPTLLDGCTLNDVAVTYAPDASFTANVDVDAQTQALATATYACPTW